MRHPLSPPSKSKIKPPYIPPPKKNMSNYHTEQAGRIVCYKGTPLWHLTDAEHGKHLCEHLAHKETLLNVARADVEVLVPEVEWLRVRNAELEKKHQEAMSRINTLTLPIWVRVVAWVVSFAGGFWLTMLIMDWMHR